MNEILTKINQKINFQQKLKNEIENIDTILSKDIHILSDTEIDELKKERMNLEQKIIKSKLSFDKKFENFFYKIEDLDNTPEIQWLILGVIPSSTIGVFYGAPGTGKSSILLHYCNILLEKYDNTYIIYIDADMSKAKVGETKENMAFTVKDKIEELEEEKKYYYSQCKIEKLNDKIEVLQELLEEGEKNG